MLREIVKVCLSWRTESKQQTEPWEEEENKTPAEEEEQPPQPQPQPQTASACLGSRLRSASEPVSAAILTATRQGKRSREEDRSVCVSPHPPADTCAWDPVPFPADAQVSAGVMFVRSSWVELMLCWKDSQVNWGAADTVGLITVPRSLPSSARSLRACVRPLWNRVRTLCTFPQTSSLSLSLSARASPSAWGCASW